MNVGQNISAIIHDELQACKAQNPFFNRFPETASPADFRWCMNLYHLSKHFAELLKVRWDRFQDAPHDVFSSHYAEEKDHPEMLRKWMMDLGLEDPELSNPNFETEALISILYRAAAICDNNLSLLLINSTAEGYAFAMYVHALDILKASGFTDVEYWEVHTVADEEHSDVYEYISDMSPEQLKEAEHLVRYTCRTLDTMLASWFE
ncbi:hypothetical protein D3C78_19200 [compost metagenome]